MNTPDLIRIGDKLINRQKIDRSIGRILELRARGLSQQQVAAQLGVDRTFVSRLETLGEVRKGRSIALIGFPVANKQQLADVAAAEGIEFVLLMTNDERWDYVRDRTGLDVLSEVMDMIADVRRHDAVILIGSHERNEATRALIDADVYSIDLGPSPLQEDHRVEVESLRQLIRAIRNNAPEGEF